MLMLMLMMVMMMMMMVLQVHATEQWICKNCLDIAKHVVFLFFVILAIRQGKPIDDKSCD